MNLDIIIGKGTAAVIVLLFFGLVVWLLRYLYGPGGRFRDPVWDKWNEDARQEGERQRDAALREAFLSYARAFFSGNAAEDQDLQLKIDHSLRVLAYAQRLCAAEPALRDAQSARALRLAALFHDVGRFEQFARWKTFADNLSCNHGLLGVRIMRAQGFLDKEPPALRRMVLVAIASHNKPSIPRGISGAALDVLKALRDADKLDILNVLEQEMAKRGPRDGVVLMHLEDRADAYTPSVLDAFLHKRSALYSDMRYINDFRLMLCCWLYDLNYETSFAIVRQEGRYDRIIDGLAHIPRVQEQVRAGAAALLDAH